MLKIPLKLFEFAVKQGSKEIDFGNPLVIDTVNMIVDIAKEVVKPW